MILSLVYFFYLAPRLPVVNAYAAKRACTCYFVTNRTAESIIEKELSTFPFNLTSLEYDDNRKYATASFFGLKKVQSHYDPDLGCSLQHGAKQKFKSFEKPLPSFINPTDTLLWPFGNREMELKIEGVDYSKINEALDLAFDSEGLWEKQTLSMVIIHKDTLVAERYAPDIQRETLLLGWSMTKSVCNALMGILHRDGKLKLTDKMLFEEWSNDDRGDLTIDNLLRMNSGLQWNEDYGDNSDATTMLFRANSASDYAVQLPLEFKPTVQFEYSSGTTNLLSRLIRKKFDNHSDYLAFPYKRLLYPLNIFSTQLETDASGQYVLSSFMNATTRDWSKLGLLYLNDGVWNQDTILSKEWIDYSFSETPNSEGKYGAHIWRNGSPKEYPSCPQDTYRFSGYEGQYVFMIPSQDLVVVRMGLSKGPPFDMDKVLKSILDAIK